MKYLPFFIALLASVAAINSYGQACSTTNGTNCVCPDGSTQCELLPDVMISWYFIANDTPREYSQTGNGINDGKLKISGAIPNVGYGALEVIATDTLVCGTDTLHDPTRSIALCPDGTEPKYLLNQRIFSKDGDSITYYDRPAGSQSYHPTHLHSHVDDWMYLSLRIEDVNEPDTLKWPIVGNGSKLGYCLADFEPCTYSGFYGACRDNHLYGMGNILTNLSNIPNFGMGGGTYSCGIVRQGLSVGYVDLYNKDTEGMNVIIPPGTCNGLYWIVAEIDPENHFLESNEDNNWTAVPIQITKQDPPGNPVASISYNGDPVICNGQSVTLTANAGSNFIWSNGATTQSIEVDQPGDYFVEVTNYCGTAVSDTVTVFASSIAAPIIAGDTVCRGSSITLSVGSINGYWYNKPTGGNLLATGSSFSINNIDNTVNLFVEAVDTISGTNYSCSSPRTEVEMYVEQANIVGLDSSFYVTDAPVQIYSANQLGTFSGRGITYDGNGNIYFSPALAGINSALPITYIYTTPSGCKLDTVIYVQVLDPNATAIAIFNETPLGIYPNPAETAIVITLPLATAENQLLLLFDSAGKKLFEERINGNATTHQLDVSTLPKGMYILRLNTLYGSQYAKFMKL